ncbi:hypothetical protein TEA_013851 [Camellia sinensis var. sinensis]|uniref:Uncharacterized protein n=1 Tax=Camellia sinensis var. sinensis TaxID=542762 RepID=A0A4S4EFN3_CAMSN|nr:hypothetical protein TEA_013851 [Camellia sinensis var. sinensis]
MNLSFGRLPLIYTIRNWHKLAQMTVNSVVGICKIVLISWHSKVPRSLRWVFVALQRALVNFIPYWKLRRIPKEICKHIEDSKCPQQVWEAVDDIVTKHAGKVLPTEYCVGCIAEDEFKWEEYEYEDTLLVYSTEVAQENKSAKK